MVKKPVAVTKPCGANTPVTWGELFLLLEERPKDLQQAILEKIMALDAA
ncbi:hypothetical protein [Devosia riboflavina]|nr:hypothetical protein [Devosia riboflavina]